MRVAAAIQAFSFPFPKAWMPATSAGMTAEGAFSTLR